jgi:predicted MFS family arabinose efflux permease
MKKENPAPKLLLPAIFISVYANTSPAILSSLLLIDIGNYFRAPVGITGQLQTTSSILAIITAILISIISIKFSPRNLLLTGLILHLVSAIGSGIAPSLIILFLAFSISGIAKAIVSPMANTLVGIHFPIGKRSSVLSWLLAGSAFTFVIGSPIIGYLETIGGWRLSFYIYIIPVILLALFVSFLGIPKSKQDIREDSEVSESIRAILFNPSALSCLIGVALASASSQAFGFYSFSYFRIKYNVPINRVSLLLSGLSLCFTVGCLTSGRLLNRVGRKDLTMVSCIFMGLSSMVYLIVPYFWASLGIVLMGGFFHGIRSTASSSLALEQIPSYRGSMMSMSSAFINLGTALGSGLGGYLLLGGDWVLMGFVLGFLSLIASLNYYLWSIDPSK